MFIIFAFFVPLVVLLLLFEAFRNFRRFAIYRKEHFELLQRHNRMSERINQTLRIHLKPAGVQHTRRKEPHHHTR